MAYVITTQDHVVKFITQHLVHEGNVLKVGGMQLYDTGYNIYSDVPIAPNLRVEASCFDGTTIWHNDNFTDLESVQPLRDKVIEQQEVIDSLLLANLMGGL